MIRLTQCSKNPNHWYLGHTTECPWCRVGYNTGRDSFPHPDQNPGLTQIPGSQERHGSLPFQQTEETYAYPVKSPSTPPSPKHSPIVPGKRRGGVTIAGILILSICLIGGLYFLPQANPQLSNLSQQGTTVPATIPHEDIRFDPIDDKYIGDKFTITATTSLAAGEEVIFEINEASVTQRQKNIGFSGITGIATVTKGDPTGPNNIAFDADASVLHPHENIVKATSVNQAVTGTTRFNALEGIPPTGHLSPIKKIITASSTPIKQFFPVTITAKNFNSYYYRGETIHFSGTNTDSNTVYLFMLGPNLPENGVRFTLIPKNDPVKNDEPETFTQVPVSSVDRTWSYDWDMKSVVIDPGIYIIYAVSAPRDRTHLSGITPRALPIIIKPPFISGTVRKSPVSKGDSVIIEGFAEGNPSAGVAVWILGNNYTTRTVIPVQSDTTYKFEINGATTKTMATGDYYVVLQHPDNNQFDINYNANTGQVVNRQTGTALFSLKGPNSLQSSAAADALVTGITDDPSIDDDIKTVKFSIK